MARIIYLRRLRKERNGSGRLGAARQNLPEKMTVLYQKYKDNGIVSGEILPKAAKHKAARAPLAPEDLAVLSKRLGLLAASDMTAEQIVAFIQELTKLHGFAYQKKPSIKGVNASGFMRAIGSFYGKPA